jgi:hypothetical protein
MVLWSVVLTAEVLPTAENAWLRAAYLVAASVVIVLGVVRLVATSKSAELRLTLLLGGAFVVSVSLMIIGWLSE